MATLIPNEEGSVDVFEDPCSTTSLWESLSDGDGENDPIAGSLDLSTYISGRSVAVVEQETTPESTFSYTTAAGSEFSVTSFTTPTDFLTAGEEKEELPEYESSSDWENEDTVYHVANEVRADPLLLMVRPEPVVSSLNSNVGGALVNIVGGVHKGKTAFLVKQTEKKVGVRFADDDPNKVRYLALSSVTLSVQNRGFHPLPNTASVQSGGEQARTSTLNPTNLEPTMVSSSDVTLDEKVVEIVAGVHKGKRAFIVKHTPKKVGVRLLDDPSTVRYLAPTSVRDDSSGSTVHASYSSTETRGAQVTAQVLNSYPVTMELRSSCAPHQRLPDSRTMAGTPDACEVSDAGAHPLLHSFLSLPIQSICLEAPGEKTPLRSTFAALLYQRRLVEIRVKATSNVGELPRQFEDPSSGRKYELLVTKLHSNTVNVGSTSFSRSDVDAVYVLVSGPGISTIDLKTDLNKIAAFGELVPKKAASRLELLFSTARRATATKKTGNEFLRFDDLTSNDFELVPEGSNEGCGFCPPHYITKWLGNYAVGKRTFALQVRVFSSKIGVAKGVLMVKPGIEKIQLPMSMLKVGPTHENVRDKAVVLVTTNGIFPVSAHCHTLRILYGDKPPPKSFRPKKLSNMILSLLKSLSVPSNLVDEYAEEFQLDRGKMLKHASLIGLADPTNSLPSGHVFVTGIQGLEEFGKELFVTRYPCTETADGTMWPLVREKPDGMSNVDWTWLQSLHFGGIIFGNPLPGQPPLPNMIADGDLDGDLYFVCWHKEILKHIHTVKVLPCSESLRNDQIEAETVRSWNDNWLEDAQDLMRSVGTLVDRHKLISALYKAMERAEDPSMAVAFSRAYKEAIDVGKHGGSVKLSFHYWGEIHERFHRYLSDA